MYIRDVLVHGVILDLLDRAPTPPPEIDMKMPANHLDLGTILASLAEIEGQSVRLVQYSGNQWTSFLCPFFRAPTLLPSAQGIIGIKTILLKNPHLNLQIYKTVRH